MVPRFPVAFRPPAFASQVIRPLLGDWAFLTVGLPGHHGAGAPTRFPRSTRARFDRGGCLLYPGGGGAHPADKKSPAGACRFAAASPYTPPTTTRLAWLTITRHQRRFTQFTRPVCPCP
jgi:hypothetical protein